jgi:hypothetical protein
MSLPVGADSAILNTVECGKMVEELELEWCARSYLQSCPGPSVGYRVALSLNSSTYDDDRLRTSDSHQT